jgi:hypothetical protein
MYSLNAAGSNRFGTRHPSVPSIFLAKIARFTVKYRFNYKYLTGRSDFPSLPRPAAGQTL